MLNKASLSSVAMQIVVFCTCDDMLICAPMLFSLPSRSFIVYIGLRREWLDWIHLYMFNTRFAGCNESRCHSPCELLDQPWSPPACGFWGHPHEASRMQVALGFAQGTV